MSPAETLAEFERRSATRDFAQVAPLVAAGAVFFFNDGTFRGLDQVRGAFESTWALNPEEESYVLEDVEWLAESPDVAVCTYGFRWEGLLHGRRFRSLGRGTAVLVREGATWKVAHEHLSARP